MTRYAKALARLRSLEKKRACHIKATHTENMSVSLLNNWTPRMTRTVERCHKAMMVELDTHLPKRRRNRCKAHRKAKAEGRA